MRIWRAGLLAAFLLFAQAILIAHGIGHASGHGQDGGEADEICCECLALSSIQGAPPQAAQSPVLPVAALLANAIAVPPAPTFARHAPFLSRAPPVLQS